MRRSIQKKKTVLFALVLVLVLSMISGLALAEDGKWPVRDLTGTVVQLKPGYLKTIQEQSYAGPGRGYALSGSFRPNRVNKATALLSEGDYVLVDMDYATAKRVVYFSKKSLVSAEQKAYGCRPEEDGCIRLFIDVIILAKVLVREEESRDDGNRDQHKDLQVIGRNDQIQPCSHIGSDQRKGERGQC